ncbi:hypothetical protein QL285_085932 [Trifolium repens]|nr:hypothetical protein QL285_085932 [Trifolium repens]
MGVSNRQIWFLFYVAVGCSRSASFVTFWFWCDERRHSLPPPSRSAPELLSLGLVLRVVAGFVFCCRGFFLFSSTVCLLFWILVSWFVFRSVEICRDQIFQFCIRGV